MVLLISCEPCSSVIIVSVYGLDDRVQGYECIQHIRGDQEILDTFKQPQWSGN
jgi:hypothetical protein